MRYDVIFLNNHVFIGMEDVSVTYRTSDIKEGISLGDVHDYVLSSAHYFDESEQVKRIRELKEGGRAPYYPTQWELPCKALVAPSGALKNISLRNNRELCDARTKFEAREYNFTSGYDAVLKKFQDDGKTLVNKWLKTLNKDTEGFVPNPASISNEYGELWLKTPENVRDILDPYGDIPEGDPVWLHVTYEPELPAFAASFEHSESGNTIDYDFGPESTRCLFNDFREVYEDSFEQIAASREMD